MKLHEKREQERKEKLESLAPEMKGIIEKVWFKASRATSTHDKECTCATCDIKRDIYPLYKKI